MNARGPGRKNQTPESARDGRLLRWGGIPDGSRGAGDAGSVRYCTVKVTGTARRLFVISLLVTQISAA
jgi:hypothetical protein